MTTALVVVTALVAAPAVPTSAPQFAAAATTGADDRADWTMLVYAVADTEGIGPVMEQDLAELAALPDDPERHIVVLVDLPDRNDTGIPTVPLPGVGTFTDARLLVLEHHRYQQVRDEGELNMGRPTTLSTFIQEGIDRFPAQHYGLTLMDHGGGELGGYYDVDPQPRLMSIPELREGITAGLQAAGVPRLDVLFHSACLMSNYEAASALGPLARVIAGSEEEMLVYAMLSPAGFAALDRDLDAGGDADVAQDVGEAFVDGYADRLEQDETQVSDLRAVRDLVAVSVVDGDGMAALDAAMRSFTTVATADMAQIVTPVARARAEALSFGTRIPGGAGDLGLIDLGDFLRHLTDVPDEVAVARDAAYAALQRVVTHQVTGSGTRQATGLNVFLPSNADQVGDYLTDGTPPAGWGGFVAAYLEASAGAGSDGAQLTSHTAQVVSADASGIKIQARLTGRSGDVVDAETQVYADLGGQPDALAAVLPAYLDAGATGAVQGVWDYSVTALTDGTTAAPATTAYQAQSGGLVGTLVARYTPPGGGEPTDVGIRVLLDSNGTISSVTVVDLTQDQGQGTSSGIQLSAGGTLRPYVYVASGGTFQRTLSDQQVTVSDGLSVALTRLPAGTSFDIGVVVSDAGGRYDGAFTSGSVQ